MPYPLPLTRTEAYLAYKAGVVQLSDLKPSLAVPRNGIDEWLAYWTGLAEDYPKKEDGTPHILQEEEAYIAYLCGVINEYPEKCLRRVGAYLRYLISARWGRPDHPLNREELYLSLIKTQVIPSGDPSSDITIEGTCKAPFVDVKMYGDTFQQSYTGKNLVGFGTYSYEKNGITCTTSPDGTITLNGTRTGSPEGAIIFGANSPKFNLSGTFTMTVIILSGSFSGANIGYNATDANGTQKFYQGYGSNGTYSMGTITPTQEKLDTTTGINVLIGSGASTFDNLKFKIQVVAGENHDSDYEPYVGGVPSPNPDYPQQIQTVTGEQTVVVTGKNLLNYNTIVQTTLNGVTLSLADDGTITLNGTCSSDNTRFAFDGLSLALDGTYTLSSEVISGTITNATDMTKIRLFKSGYSGAIRVDLANTSASSTSSASGDYTLNDIRIDNGVVLTNYKIKIQLEKSATSTSFEPYAKHDYHISLGSLELCKLGTYQDYIYKDGDDWKVHKETKRISVDGSQRRGDITQYGFAQIRIDSEALYVSAPPVSYCSNLPSHDIYGSLPKTYAIRSSSTQCNFRLYFTPQLENFNAYLDWCAENKPSVVAPLQQSAHTDTVITDTDLVAQLEALVNGGAEDGTTYIKVNATNPNLPGLLYVEAPKYE